MLWQLSGEKEGRGPLHHAWRGTSTYIVVLTVCWLEKLVRLCAVRLVSFNGSLAT